MKKEKLLALIGSICLILILASLAFMTACAKPAPAPTPAPAKPIELKFIIDRPGDLYDELYTPWIDAVHEATGGRIKITTVFGAVPSPETYDAIVAGTGDLAGAYLGMWPGRFPCFDVLQVSNLDTVCHRPARAAWELYKAFPEIQAELSETKVLAAFASAPAPPGTTGLFTAKKPVYTVEDFKGLKCQAPGKWFARTVTVLGGSPMSMIPADFYAALQRGILDAVMGGAAFVTTFKLVEVCCCWHMLCFGFMPWFFGMNWDTWNSLPPDLQEILESEEISGAHFCDLADCHWYRQGVRNMEVATNEGMQIIELSPEEMARFIEAQKPVQDEFVAELEAKGLPGKELLEESHRLYTEWVEPHPLWAELGLK